jgi:hypothetical protein
MVICVGTSVCIDGNLRKDINLVCWYLDEIEGMTMRVSFGRFLWLKAWETLVLRIRSNYSFGFITVMKTRPLNHLKTRLKMSYSIIQSELNVVQHTRTPYTPITHPDDFHKPHAKTLMCQHAHSLLHFRLRNAVIAEIQGCAREDLD